MGARIDLDDELGRGLLAGEFEPEVVKAAFDAEGKPMQSFLHRYLDLCEPCGEAPLIYHLFLGLGLLSMAAGRDVEIPGCGGFRPIHPNLYLCLLGKSSGSKKSTAFSMAKTILRRCGTTLGKPFLFPNTASPEAFHNTLKRQPEGVIIAPEFGKWLRNAERDYMTGFLEFMSELYDGEDVTRELSGGKVWDIKNPYVSIWGGCSFEWFRSAAKASDFAGGFMARFVYVPWDGTAERKPRTPPPDPQGMAEVCELFARIAAVKGESILTDEAAALYDQWYLHNPSDLALEVHNELLAPVYSRLEQTARKIAALISLSKSPDAAGLTVDAASMRVAIALAQDLKYFVRNLALEELGGDSRWLRDRERILHVIERYGSNGSTASLKMLAQNAKMPTRRRDEILDALRTEGTIEARTVKRAGRTVTEYRIIDSTALR